MTEKESLSSALTKIDKKSKFIIFFVGALVLLLALVGVKEISTTRSWLYPPTWLAVITGLVTLWRFCKKQKENPFANIFRTLKDDYVLDKYVTIQLFSIFYAFGQGAGIGAAFGFFVDWIHELFTDTSFLPHWFYLIYILVALLLILLLRVILELVSITYKATDEFRNYLAKKEG